MKLHTLLVVGVAAMALSYVTFAGGGDSEMQSFVRSHKLYFRGLTAILVLAEIEMVVLTVLGHRS